VVVHPAIRRHGGGATRNCGRRRRPHQPNECEGAAPKVSRVRPAHIRLLDLRDDDLRAFPVWEVAEGRRTDIAGEKVTAVARPGRVSSREGSGLFAVRCTFSLANGQKKTGFCVPSPDGPDILGYLRPTVCTATGQVPFWFVEPRARSMTAAAASVHLDVLYAALDLRADEVFPASFAADVEVDELDVASGVLEGFTLIAYLPSEDRFDRLVLR